MLQNEMLDILIKVYYTRIPHLTSCISFLYRRGRTNNIVSQLQWCGSYDLICLRTEMGFMHVFTAPFLQFSMLMFWSLRGDVKRAANLPHKT